jgi:hypothetical protein
LTAENLARLAMRTADDDYSYGMQVWLRQERKMDAVVTYNSRGVDST